MSIDSWLLFLARLLPPLARHRYLEEWRADLAGAAQLGLPARGVLLGAVALVVRIDRDRPEHSGEPRGALPRRLARRGAGLLVAAGGVLAGLYLTGGNAPDPGVVSAGSTAAFVIAARALAVLAVLSGVAGVLFFLAAGAAARTWLARASLLALLAGPALMAVGLAGAADSWPAALAGVAVLLAGMVGALVVAAGSPALQLQPRTATRARRLPIAVGGMLLLVPVVVLGGVDLLVWNPMSKVPALPLSSIYALMEQRDGFSIGGAVGFMVVWAAFWLAAGTAVLVGACRRGASSLTPRRIAVLMLGIISAAVFFRFFAGFGIGVSVADSFGTSGGDSTTTSALLACTGQLALAGAALCLGCAPRITAQPVAEEPA